MKAYLFKGLLQNSGWITPAFVICEEDGTIHSIAQSNEVLPEDEISIEEVNGYVLPGFQNAHSHAFQYAMAGLAENHPKDHGADNFWSWRDKMYRIALSVNPDQMEAIAAMLYSEMIRHGYTHVAEFHYLHHDKGGHTYSSLAEMGERLVAAAQKAGIRITLVPMFYQKGGFNQDPEDHQRRFISQNLEDYWRLLEASKRAISHYEGAFLGFGAHSIRAVHGMDLKLLYEQGPAHLPFHIHIAEQLKEVEDAIQYAGMRSVEYLFDQIDINHRCHLVHATHLDDRELELIASSGAHVVLCPTTEANLGDGLFRFRDYKALNGKWSIGTDSHVSLNPLEELRLLDYGQRLISHQRDTFVDEGGDSGKYAIDNALLGGRKAMGNPTEQYFDIGQPLDAVVIDADSALISVSSSENLLSTILYSTDQSALLGTLTNGVWRYQRNQIQVDILNNFQKAIREMGIR